MLKYLASPPSDLKSLALLPGLSEVLLEHQALARTGLMDSNSLLNALHETRALGLRPVLTWDLLPTDEALANGAALLRSLPLHQFSAIRVQDVGVARYVRQHCPIPLQLILETGNHNLLGIQAWIRDLEPDRVILSNELPQSLLHQIADAIQVDIEIAVLGRLLIFYSPRKLIGAAEQAAMGDFRSRFAIEELTGKCFPLLENQQGTLMYYEKDLCLLSSLDRVAAAGVTWVRLDLKFFPSELVPALAQYLHSGLADDLAEVKRWLSPRQTNGFFKSNRTDKQFSKLTNPHLMVREDVPLVATVLESSKKEGYTALLTETPLSSGDSLCYVNGEGDVLPHQIVWIRDASGNKLSKAHEPGLWLVNHARRSSAGTRFYRKEGESS